ncbi:hypothetical protein H6P81_000017 [Aristolochia fimbriata]|uniref:Uncharacterized protein n=1 Tax=Aristolochia fimbriata TaxID=158543 RepID=A0AAV7F465_ARIFI|nr:hypothetical protein H6P81_000017 [Aristolochia fimbriata]
MGAGLKKDLRVSRVGPGGSLNAFFVFSSGYFTRTCRGKEEGGTSTLGERSTTESFQDGPAAPGKRIEEASDSFMHAPLGSGDIAQLVELRSCNWVVAITGWMSNCPGEGGRMGSWSRSSMDRTWTIVGVGGSPRVPSSGIPGEEDQVGPCEQLDALSPFNPLSEMWQRKENPWTDPIVSTRRNYEITPRTPSASRV